MVPAKSFRASHCCRSVSRDRPTSAMCFTAMAVWWCENEFTPNCVLELYLVLMRIGPDGLLPHQFRSCQHGLQVIRGPTPWLSTVAVNPALDFRRGLGLREADPLLVQKFFRGINHLRQDLDHRSGIRFHV